VIELQKALYTAVASATGGREGHAASSDGVIDLDMRVPKEMGGPGGGTNPEQLFAAGYSACFQSALGVAGRRKGIDTSNSTVTTRVTIGATGDGAYGLAAAIEVVIPGTDEAVAHELVDAAHQICPYSNATRGNIKVDLSVG
jgi:lipoyl-dependent peroxiredoxin